MRGNGSTNRNNNASNKKPKYQREEEAEEYTITMMKNDDNNNFNCGNDNKNDNDNNKSAIKRNRRKLYNFCFFQLRRKRSIISTLLLSTTPSTTNISIFIDPHRPYYRHSYLIYKKNSLATTAGTTITIVVPKHSLKREKSSTGQKEMLSSTFWTIGALDS